jgi:hypothetical protein
MLKIQGINYKSKKQLKKTSRWNILTDIKYCVISTIHILLLYWYCVMPRRPQSEFRRSWDMKTQCGIFSERKTKAVQDLNHLMSCRKLCVETDPLERDYLSTGLCISFWSLRKGYTFILNLHNFEYTLENLRQSKVSSQTL